MQKQRLDLEYPLNARKPDLLWQLMSTDHGLERWLADEVKEENGMLSLMWGNPYGEHHTLHAHILEREKNSHIKLQWVEEDDPDAYWEMRIGRSELTEEYASTSSTTHRRKTLTTFTTCGTVTWNGSTNPADIKK